MGGIFINYRSEDCGTTAALIDHELVTQFGSDQVFQDSRSIPAGTDFVEELLRRLRACSVLLVVIGPHWLTLPDATGKRRIDDPQDWIRREIVEALTHRLRVIPVLTDGVTLPAKVDLPDDIAELSRRQYVPLRLRYTTVDLAYLVEQISKADPTLAKAAARGQSSVNRARGVAVMIAVCALIAVFFLAVADSPQQASGSPMQAEETRTVHVRVPADPVTVKEGLSIAVYTSTQSTSGTSVVCVIDFSVLTPALTCTVSGVHLNESAMVTEPGGRWTRIVFLPIGPNDPDSPTLPITFVPAPHR